MRTRSRNDAGSPTASPPACRHKESAALKDLLKKEIKKRGYRYQDIADELGLSLMTIKRHLNAERVPIEALEDICGCIGLSLVELVEAAREGMANTARDLEEQQELALASEYALALVRTLLYSGLTVADILAEYDIDEPTIILLLARLDRLKLIDLHPGNRVRIKGPRAIEWRPGGPMRREIDRDIRENFMQMDFAHTEEYFGYEPFALSEASIVQLEEQMRQLVRTARMLHQMDLSLARDEKQWINLLVARRVNLWNFPLRNGELRPPRGVTRPVPASPSPAPDAARVLPG